MSDQLNDLDAAVEVEVEADQYDAAIQVNLANQHDAAVQVNLYNRTVQASVNQLDRVQIYENQLFHDNENPLYIMNMQDPHQQINVPLQCRCAIPPEHIIANLPRPIYQLSFCCGTHCPRYRMIVTCLRVDEIEAMFNLIFSQAFQCNSDFNTTDSLDR